ILRLLLLSFSQLPPLCLILLGAVASASEICSKDACALAASVTSQMCGLGLTGHLQLLESDGVPSCTKESHPVAKQVGREVQPNPRTGEAMRIYGEANGSVLYRNDSCSEPSRSSSAGVWPIRRFSERVRWGWSK